MALDSPTPLATAAQMKQGAFADLVRSFSDDALNEIMVEATRACETETQRRLAPFVGHFETHRCQGVDPDEYTDTANLPLDLQGALGRSYAYAMGASTLVRHLWLNEYAPLYPEYWQYTNISLEIVRSYGGSENLVTTQFQGPEIDSGHVWFNLGKFIPIGSLARVTYSAGYFTVPADLVRACKYMAAAVSCRELDPMLQSQHGHDPDKLEALAVSWLSPYMRS
jgi:hypothetical protein